MKPDNLVSVHGGHSGQFCDHATDTLEDIVKLYIEKEFAWVGITEHTPAISGTLLDPGQKKAGLTPDGLLKNFEDYFVECKRLKEKYEKEIQIFVAMEIETYSGYEEFVPFLIGRFQPDYIVGSVHFINDICFDYSQKQYNMAVDSVGGIENLYLQYFDQQYQMIKLLRPAVVGHFDLIRIFDPQYKERLTKPEIMERIERNLSLIKELNLILDLNLRALLKGAAEPYISQPILQRAHDLEISVVPGDDSHGLSSVGAHLEEGIDLLKTMGFDTDWRKPVLISSSRFPPARE